jgi:hypothetical protein
MASVVRRTTDAMTDVITDVITDVMTSVVRRSSTERPMP